MSKQLRFKVAYLVGMQNTSVMALGSTAEISSCGAWRGSLDCHKQENVDEFCALAFDEGC